MSSVHDIVAKVWKLCDVLRDDGITYHQYVNELTYLLFLKMAQETGTEKLLLKGCRWSDLIAKSDDPDEQYRLYLHLLNDLGTRGRGRVKHIFTNPTTFLHHPASLNKLVIGIDAIDWHIVSRERLGDIYEGVLQKNANEKKSGAGQYFTPRPLIDCIINVIKPAGGDVILDPAVGTAGFFISANAYLRNSHKTTQTPLNARFVGVELVRDTHRLALMNAMLHEIDGEIELGDSLSADEVCLPKADLIITNPPFGNKKGAGRPMRSDLPFPTSNKQLAFLQLIYRSLKTKGRAAVVLPDNVLFEDGIGAKVRADLMNTCNLHTILRLPTGIFYAAGVKTNVLFFSKGVENTNSTERVWVFDLRSNMPTFGKRTPLLPEHFAEFENSYGDSSDGTGKRRDTGEEGRFRCFTREQIASRNDNLDLSWLKEYKIGSMDNFVEPEELVALIREKLQMAVDELDNLTAVLEGDNE